MGGNHGHGDMGELLLDVFDQADSIAIGKAHVGKAEVGFQLRDQGHGLTQIGRAVGLQAHAAQGDIQ